ncbi:hypothetical protein [Leptothoe sp. PORK10 BA2]|uniref:hypothetical protein n=1 Tax=Leptothoe sp. PORK10 BA2 TaxID=3110254 RepID=UPI002B206C28|nr:hypothetical protein [Leptothoe sp. PORK10 BA2]MEA5465285.1 hypothetical protein [Leptothoe sp. PORK10 BA2]
MTKPLTGCDWMELAAIAANCIASKLAADLLRAANDLLAITVSSIKTAKGRDA